MRQGRSKYIVFSINPDDQTSPMVPKILRINKGDELIFSQLPYGNAKHEDQK